MSVKVRGKCECEKVMFDVQSPRETVTICHCSQCRRVSGHLWASTHALFSSVEFLTDEGLEWYASSEIAKRGFCRNCGSSLFYRLNDEDGIGIAAGCLEGPTGFRIGKHIFTASKGDYYDITDSIVQLETY